MPVRQKAMSAPARRRSNPPSPATQTRRADIVAAAIQVIARDGIRACTVTALEHETSFARGHFTYHFRSKEEIIGLAFAAVGSDWATTQIEAVGILPNDTPALARLETQVRAAVGWAQQRPDYFRCLMNFRVEMMRDPQAFPRAPIIRAQFLATASAMIAQATTDGDCRPPAAPEVEARILFGTVDGLLMHAALDPAFCTPDALADRLWQVVADRLGVGTR
jgi:AcrR family transcriptional regulator